MEQRPLRLGDIVDDYCSRERRVTNHAIVALVGDAIQLTRCTACDAEHAYKGGKEPRLRKKPQATELYDRVLADVSGQRVAGSPADESGVSQVEVDETVSVAIKAGADGATTDEAADAGPEDSWPAHRRLIRATLPRTDNEPPPPRPIPEFTMHQRQPTHGRGFRFRGGGGGNGQPPNGFGHGRQGQPSGRPGRHRGKKRSR